MPVGNFSFSPQKMNLKVKCQFELLKKRGKTLSGAKIKSLGVGKNVAVVMVFRLWSSLKGSF